jgi:hypothetical protein
MSETRVETAAAPMPGSGLRGFSGGVILVVGVLVVPLLLTLLFGTSTTAPDAADFVRMAFSRVIGATVAVLTVIGLLIHRILRRARGSTVARFALIAVLITWWQIGAINGAATSLLANLSGLE